MIQMTLPFTLLDDVTRACHGLTNRHVYKRHFQAVQAIFNEHVRLDPRTFLFQICWSTEEAMARFNNTTFSSLRLTEEDKKNFLSWAEKTHADALTCTADLLGRGFKVSVSYVVEQNAFCLSLIGTDNTKHHKDMIMTTWSDDLNEVMVMAHYKHVVLCDGGEWPTQQDGNRWG